jgi:hypothetical protein
LNAGIRQIELDIFADSQGGRYAHPAGMNAVAAAGLPKDPEFDPDGVMSKPGFKVMHIQDYDYRSTCQPLIACLKIVRAWSLSHPGHVPVYILLETKTDLPAQYHATVTEKFTHSVFDALDAEIRSVFAANELITPDQVRGKHKTLEEAVLHNDWPALAAARGKVAFLMDQRPVGPVYLEGHPSLRGRISLRTLYLVNRTARSLKRTRGRRRKLRRWCEKDTWSARGRMKIRKRRVPTTPHGAMRCWQVGPSYSVRTIRLRNPLPGRPTL